MTLDQKLSPQARQHSVYLISYLRTLLDKQIQDENRRGGEESKDGDDTIHVGKNDKYLISKLKTYNISLEKIDGYIAKL